MHAKLFSQELTQFKESFRRWLQLEVVPHHDQWEKDGICPREIYLKAGANGFLLMNQSEEFSGMGLDFRFSAVLTEELAMVGATGIPFWLHSDIIAPYIEDFGSPVQKKKYLPKMASGEIISAIAMTEPGTGSDLQGIQATAVLQDNRWIINGAKTFISNGINADLVIVAAQTPSAEKTKYAPISLFLVDRGSPGFEKSKSLAKLGLKAQDTAELNFVN